jgi:hypothetical protein
MSAAARGIGWAHQPHLIESANKAEKKDQAAEHHHKMRAVCLLPSSLCLSCHLLVERSLQDNGIVNASLHSNCEPYI